MTDGRRYTLNVWTFDFLPLARYPWPYEANDDTQAAEYVLPPDLFVECLDRDVIHRVITELHMLIVISVYGYEVALLAVYFFGGSMLAMFGPHIGRSIDLALHEQRTQGVVVRQVWPGAIIYRYSVAGREYYAGSQHTYSEGGAVEVRYSSRQPAISTSGDPLGLPKSILFAAVIITVFLACGYFERKRKEKKAAAAQNPES